MFLAFFLAASMQAQPVSAACDGTTPQVNECLSARLNRAQARLDEYVAAAVRRYGDVKEKSDAVALGIRASQAAFEAYRAIECGTVHEAWKDGTIRTAMNINCQIRLTDERTRTVWANWLRYVDRTPPILPEPKPTL